MDGLLSHVLDAHGGLDRWADTDTITARVSIGGPIWAVKGWDGALTDETVTLDTRRERTEFAPFTAPELRSVFSTGPERVTVLTVDGHIVEELSDARDAFAGYLRATRWDRLHLGYFIGYAFWNYLTSPFLFTWPGVEAHEIEPWREAGQEWRRLRVRFPDTIATHSPEQVFYYDSEFMQRRMDYVTEILGGTLVAHYSGRPKKFDGLVFPTWRRVFRRNQDGTSNLSLPSITIDIDAITVGRGGSS
ncbi:hypothetical protein [Streptomyces sp. AK02-01A]|uniref:hypothetical protein n=1 Tax=Streptomyces sp. AK02-01A TaxID=3028648 RepID=UPI0029B0AFA4|nr:hypothetical protein [Streptomyces sp. AK02-01A]MDX3854464.1 hypothetical protein [Streptomyces sp. AK02-01A]